MSATAADKRPEEKDPELKKQKQVEEFVAKLKEHGIRMVVFDLDLTACKRHSGGVIRLDATDKADEKKKAYPEYLADAAPDFKRVVPVLAKEGFFLSICTFTDSYYYYEESGDIRFPKSEAVAGDDLVNAFLEKTFDDENNRGIVDKFFNVAFNPGIHDPKMPENKNYHLRQVCQHYEVVKKIPLKLKECILFDDSKPNVEQADGFTAVHVNNKTAFQLPVPGLDDAKWFQ